MQLRLGPQLEFRGGGESLLDHVRRETGDFADIAGVGGASARGLIDHINGITLFHKIIRPAFAAVRRAGEIGAGLRSAVNHHDRVRLGDFGGDAVFGIHLAGHDLAGFGVDILASGKQIALFDCILRCGAAGDGGYQQGPDGDAACQHCCSPPETSMKGQF